MREWATTERNSGNPQSRPSSEPESDLPERLGFIVRVLFLLVLGSVVVAMIVSAIANWNTN